MNSKIEQLKELVKITKDTPYALKTYLQTYDNTQKKFVPFELFDDQIQLIKDLEQYDENITKKYRQAGVTTVTAAWLSKKLQLAKKETPEKVLIVANKRDTAIEMANKIKDFLTQWPDWINVGFHPDKNSESRFRLNNGCEVKAVATSKDALRGYTPTILIFDEAAYIEAGEDFWSACMASLSTGGKVIVISTPNGFDPIYYAIYDQSIRGINDFHITNLSWVKDPRYAKDLVWVKCTDIVHYMLNREQYNDDEVLLHDFDVKNFKEYYEKGYKPYSSWFEKMSKKFLYDRRKIAQELECDFLGSGDGVIPGDVQEHIAKNLVRVPKEKYMQGTLWQWKEPVQGHRYIMGCLPPNEKVLTDSGLKNIQEVDITDKLISENGDYVNIINKQIYSVINEDIFNVQVDNTFRTTSFTKEHPLLISKPQLKRNYSKLNKDYKFNERYWDFDFNYIRMEEVNVDDWIKVPNIYKKEIYGILDKKWDISKDIRNDFKIDSPLNDKEFWWFIGMWLGDGWLGNLNHSYTISICFDSKDEYYLNKINELIIRLFDRSPSFINRERNTFELVFNSKFLYYFILENFGQYSYGKKINEWVKFIPNKFKIELIKGYLASDGCWIKTEKNGKINSKISFVSINLELLESIQDIIFSLGIISSLNKLRNNKKGYIRDRLVNQKDAYNLCLGNNDSLELIKLLNNDSLDTKLNRFNLSEFNIINKRTIKSCHFSEDKEFIYFRIKNINKDKFTGDVYNFECDTHTFMCHHITTHNCDVSRGDSEDFSSINIIDFDEREQVLEYVGKIPPDDLASIAYKWGILYDCFIVIDITGGMGIATSRKLQEMNYKSLFIDGVNTQNVWEYNKKAMEKIPGINFNNKRTQIIAAFEEQVRKGFAIRSTRLLGELNTFVYINGRPDHMKGAHDDSIMSISMALYVADISFNQLQRNTSQNKAMMESWVMSERTYEPEKSFYSYGTAFDQIGSMSMDNKNVFNSNNIHEIKQAYQEYSWLFSGYRNRR
jgi:hypothetical protein